MSVTMKTRSGHKSQEVICGRSNIELSVRRKGILRKEDIAERSVRGVYISVYTYVSNVLEKCSRLLIGELVESTTNEEIPVSNTLCNSGVSSLPGARHVPGKN